MFTFKAIKFVYDLGFKAAEAQLYYGMKNQLDIHSVKELQRFNYGNEKTPEKRKKEIQDRLHIDAELLAIIDGVFNPMVEDNSKAAKYFVPELIDRFLPKRSK